MQNQSYNHYRIEEMIYDLSYEHPVSEFKTEKHTPATGGISLMQYHNCMELGLCYSGCGIFFVDGGMYPFSAGDVCVIMQNQIHIAQSDAENPSYWRFLNMDPMMMLRGVHLNDLQPVLDILKGFCLANPIVHQREHPELNAAIKMFFTEMERKEKNYQNMLKPLMWQIILLISRTELKAFDGAKQDTELIRMIAPAVHFISNNSADDIPVAFLANLCSMSVSHFRRLFKQGMGVPPTEYIFLVRIKMASILLLHEQTSVLEIANRVGYTSLSSFNRHFKRIMGHSPREWRGMH